MARRQSYKGSAVAKVHLPVDSATVIGVVTIFGSILPATGLTASALGSCTACFAALAEFASMTENISLIPEIPQTMLPFENNKVKIQELSSVLKALDLKPDRSVCQLKQDFVLPQSALLFETDHFSLMVST